MDWWLPGMTMEPSSKRGRDDQNGRTLIFDEVGKCRAQIQWEPDENERYSVGVSE